MCGCPITLIQFKFKKQDNNDEGFVRSKYQINFAKSRSGECKPVHAISEQRPETKEYLHSGFPILQENEFIYIVGYDTCSHRSMCGAFTS